MSHLFIGTLQKKTLVFSNVPDFTNKTIKNLFAHNPQKTSPTIWKNVYHLHANSVKLYSIHYHVERHLFCSPYDAETLSEKSCGIERNRL